MSSAVVDPYLEESNVVSSAECPLNIWVIVVAEMIRHNRQQGTRDLLTSTIDTYPDLGP